MRKYVESLKAGTTVAVVRLRVAFLLLIGLLVVLTLLHSAFGLIPHDPFLILSAVIGALCAVMGPFIAWKDPAMTMKMFGGVFSLFYLVTVYDWFAGNLG